VWFNKKKVRDENYETNKQTNKQTIMIVDGGGRKKKNEEIFGYLSPSI